MTSLSVLICTYNRPVMLERSLKSLISCTEEKPDQVVVVNGGDERADKIVEQYQNQQSIQVVLAKTVNKNLAASRNIGLPLCTGDIVAMTDDDAEVYPDWVYKMKRVHAEHPEAGGVGGAVIGADSDESLISRIADVATFSSPPNPGYVRTIAGVNISYKRIALDVVGLQDESLFRGEDVDFNWRIKRLGYEIYYDPAIKVLHHHRPTLKQFINQFYMYGRAYYLVRRKWPEMYCFYPHKLDSFRALLKGINFVVSLGYQPIQIAWNIPGIINKILSIPMIFLSQSAWRVGVLRQKMQSVIIDYQS